MITLVHCAFPETTAAPPPGLLSLAGSLRAFDIDVSLLDLQLNENGRNITPEEIPDMIEPSTYLVGFSTMSNMLPFAIEAARILKKRYPEKITVIGGCGVHGALPMLIERFAQIDFAFHGEAEESFPTFIQKFRNGGEWHKTPGLAYRHGQHVRVNAVPARIEKLDELPKPSYDLLDIGKYQAPLLLMTSRGCPFSCAFCDAGSLRGQKMVCRSVESLMAEINWLKLRYGISKFNFSDDTFTAGRKRVEHFCEYYRNSEANFKWAALVRVDTVDEFLMDEMASAGCQALYFGVESGSEKIRRIINKPITQETVESILAAAKERFPHVVASFIWGFPFESLVDFEQTLLLISYFKSLGIDTQLHLWAPMPRSILFEKYREQLKFDPDLISNIANTSLDIERFKQIIASDKTIFSPFYHVPHPELGQKIDILKNMGLLK